MDLTCKYLNLTLKNPIVPSASPLTQNVDTIKQLEDNGASAVVLHSLFEEQISFETWELDHFLTYGTESFAEALDYYPEPEEYKLGPDDYLEHIHATKQAVDIPVIASLNGVSQGGWIEYANKMQQAGADALELNIYYIPTDLELSSEYVESIYVDIIRDVCSSVTIPVAVKLSPHFSSLGNATKKMIEAGASGLVLFNRFYQPDIDIEKLEVKPNLILSNSNESRIVARWIAILHDRIPASLAATTGIHTAEDVIKMVMAGANVTMMCSALLKHGPVHVKQVLRNIELWMEEFEYDSLATMHGSMSQKSCPEPAAFERANYMKTLQSYV
jgi:dihydroorotate dehydrogenase (fumarate)